MNDAARIIGISRFSRYLWPIMAFRLDLFAEIRAETLNIAARWALIAGFRIPSNRNLSNPLNKLSVFLSESDNAYYVK